MNSPQQSTGLNRASLERLVSYGMAQLNKDLDIGVTSIMQGLSQLPDQKAGIIALVSRDGKPRAKHSGDIVKSIEAARTSPEEKVFLKALYHLVSKDGSLDTLPALAEKARSAGLKPAGLDIATCFFACLKSGGKIQTAEPLIQGLDLLVEASADVTAETERHAFQRLLQNAVGVATLIAGNQFKSDSRLAAALCGADATITGMRVIRSSEEATQQQSETAYGTVKTGFNYQEALNRLSSDIRETNLLPIEEAARSLPFRDRAAILLKAYALFKGEQLSPEVHMRAASLKIEVESAKLRDMDLRLSKQADPALQTERDQRAQQLYEFKVRELQFRIQYMPDDVQTRIELSETFRLEKQNDEALKTLQQAAALRMEPGQRKTIDLALGDLFYDRKQYRIALKAYDAVIGDGSPESLAKTPSSVEFSALMKKISTLLQLAHSPQGAAFAEKARDLIEPLYLLFSEVDPEVNSLYRQSTESEQAAAAH